MIREITLTAQLASRLIHHISQFNQYQFLLIGDVGLDEYLIGDVYRISPEAPVPVVDIDTKEERLGLAANVALNIKTLGGEGLTVAVLGADSTAQQLLNLFVSEKLNPQGLVSDSERKTTKKTRIMARHHHVVRVDYETKQYLSDSILAKCQKLIEDFMPKSSGIIIQDYGKGMISPQLINFIINKARSFNKPVYVDPYRTNRAEFYAGCTLIKPNYLEAIALIGADPEEFRQKPNAMQILGESLMSRTQAQQVVITQGKEGMTIFNETSIVRVPTYAREVFDVTGAGDTVIATLALGLSSGLKLEEACVLANMAAGIVVGKVGCVPCFKEELISALTHYT